MQGRLAPGEQLVLLSDGVPEARFQTGELYGFERLPSLTKNSAQQIADAAKQFGQEDDITVLTLASNQLGLASQQVPPQTTVLPGN